MVHAVNLKQGHGFVLSLFMQNQIYLCPPQCTHSQM